MYVCMFIVNGWGCTINIHLSADSEARTAGTIFYPIFILTLQMCNSVMQADGTLTANAYAWNKVANYLFIEQPVGVGFSYRHT